MKLYPLQGKFHLKSWLGPSTVIFVTLSVVLAIWIVVRSYMSMG